MTRMLRDGAPYATPPLAVDATPEELAYVALGSIDPRARPDALGVIGTNPASPRYGQQIGRVDLPHSGNGVYRVGWRGPGLPVGVPAPNEYTDRRYLVIPCLRSSRVYVLDTQPDPVRPRLVKVIEAREPVREAGNVPAHVVHGRILMSESDTSSIIRDGLNAELLRAGGYGHRLHVWDLDTRLLAKTIDLGADQQVVLDLRPAHNPTRAYGFVATLVSLADSSSSVFLWYLDRGSGIPRGEWKARRVIAIPAEAAEGNALPPLLQPFRGVPPLITNIDLTEDDRFLYVSCWGTGELRQYDVSDPFNPALTGLARLGGIARRMPHPAAPSRALTGGPQMVEVSRDGRRVYVTNSWSPTVDAQFYPEGMRGWVTKLDVGRGGGLSVDPRFLVELEGGYRPHRLLFHASTASSDSGFG